LPRPSTGQRIRIRLEPLFAATTPARVATGAGALLLVAVAAWWLLRTPAPPVERALPRASTVAAKVSTTTPPAGGNKDLVVQIAGAVVHPDVYQVVDGSRVGDIVARAGGPTADADTAALNLAARVVDGQRVYVPRVGEIVPAVTSSSPSALPSPLDLNAATTDELEKLPGIGPSTAEAIVARRERAGPFRSVDDLLDVRGIGPAKLDAIRGLVRV
jgi:competence protein ComEA